MIETILDWIPRAIFLTLFFGPFVAWFVQLELTSRRELREERERAKGEFLAARCKVVEAAEDVLSTAVKLNIGMPPELARALNRLGGAVNEYRRKEVA